MLIGGYVITPWGLPLLLQKFSCVYCSSKFESPWIFIRRSEGEWRKCLSERAKERVWPAYPDWHTRAELRDSVSHTQKPLRETAGQSGIAQCQLLNARAERLGTASASLACWARLEPLFPCQDLTLPPASCLEKFRGLRQVLPARDWNILTTWRAQLPQLSLHACVCSAWNKGFQSLGGIHHFPLATAVCPTSELNPSSERDHPNQGTYCCMQGPSTGFQHGWKQLCLLKCKTQFKQEAERCAEQHQVWLLKRTEAFWKSIGQSLPSFLNSPLLVFISKQESTVH